MPRRVKVCHVTTFWPVASYGFTYYTDALIAGMRAHRPDKHLVAAQFPSEPRENNSYKSVPCFRKDENYVAPVTNRIRDFSADIALLQYSPDLFGEDNRFPRLVKELEAMGVRTVVNPHSIFPVTRKSGFKPGENTGSFDQAYARHASCVTLHSQRMKQDMIARGLPEEKLVVIPHGTTIVERLDPAECRRELGIPEDAKVVLFFGFIWLGKGLDFLLDVFADVARRSPGAFLYIGGYTRRKALYTRAYMAYLRARIWRLGVSERAKLSGGFVAKELVPKLFSAADVVAMPYRQDYSSVSGVFHETAGMGQLMLCSDIAKFSEVKNEVSGQLVVPEMDREAWAERLTRLLTDDALADKMRGQIRGFAERTTWKVVGKMHLELYDSILNGERRSVRS